MSESVPLHVEVFAGEDGYRWRQRSTNGEIIATSEAYASKSNAVREAKKQAKRLKVEVVER